MKILHVEAGMHLYGGALQVLYLLRGLTAQGIHNILICPPGSAIRGAARGVAEVIVTPINGDLDVGFTARIRRAIRDHKPDLVHLHSRRGADVLGGIAARLAGVPCVLSRRVDNPELRAWVAIKYRLYDRVITISEGIRQILLAEGVPDNRVVCVRSAVDHTRYARTCERAWFQREFELPPETRALGVVAQLIPRKGHRYLIEALPAVLRQYPDVRVLCFGRGPLQGQLQHQIDAAGLQQHIRLVGFRDDLERIFPCLYAVIHPVEMEGLGVSLLQAAAAGVPIIGTRVGGVPEIVRNEQNGLLIPAHDTAALGAALARMLDDPAQAAAWGAVGKVLAAREFSIDAMVAGNLAVYRSCLTPPQTPPR